jgi:coenzyme F420-dependent glucose-6-phosphate dehydrogenase
MMLQLGYALSSEEHTPQKLVQNARKAEDVGFTFALISDHYHPWIDKQGQSPFVWSVLGGIAQATQKLRLGTGVTCPIQRIHPAIIAQAAATVASLMPGRFFLGVGTGENLNEHITGEKWPPFDIRAQMLEEAVEIIRLLWKGGSQSYDGQYFTVENAQIYSLPDELPPIMVAASGEKAGELAGRIGDGLISTAPEKEVVESFTQSKKAKRPMYGQVSVCWAADEKKALKTALEWWPTAGLGGELNQELPTPAHFKQATKTVREDDLAESVVCGNDPQKHLEGIQKFVDLGFEYVYVHQIGPDQDGFFNFYQQHILPELTSARVGAH